MLMFEICIDVDDVSKSNQLILKGFSKKKKKKKKTNFKRKELDFRNSIKVVNLLLAPIFKEADFENSQQRALGATV